MIIIDQNGRCFRKNETHRIAVASGKITMRVKRLMMQLLEMLLKRSSFTNSRNSSNYGDKKTSELIPMCHPLLLSGINCDIEELPQTNSFKLLLQQN